MRTCEVLFYLFNLLMIQFVNIFTSIINTIINDPYENKSNLLHLFLLPLSIKRNFP